MNAYLTKPQLRELTGTPIAARQLNWLDRNKWTYAIDCKGWPKVAKEYHDSRMGITAGEPAGATSEPDWSNYNGLRVVPKAA